MKTNCKECGTGFIANKFHPKLQKFCCRKCQVNFRSRVWRSENINRSKEIKTRYNLKSGRTKTAWTPDLMNICQQCKKNFKPDRWNPAQKYCSANCSYKFRYKLKQEVKK